MPTIKDAKDYNRIVVFWETLTTAGNASVEAYAPRASLTTASVQVTGTFGGATVVLQGSNDKATWATLEDLEHNAISLTAAGIVEFSTGVAYVKPSVSGGTGDDLDVTLVHWRG